MTAETAIRELKDCAAEARAWLFDDAGPLWCGAGRHPDGMFVETLSPDGRPVAGELRLRVQARQVYAYCQLGRLGWDGPWREVAGAAVDALVARGRRDDGLYVHIFGADGTPSDGRADLYDCAFVLLALGHAAQMLERPELLDEAERLMAAIERDWANPHGGFGEGEVDGPPRRQNPHMHLLEASIVQWQVSGGDAWAGRVRALAALAGTRFVEPASGALTEFFAPDWSRPDTDEGHAVEPGHCFEWTWLFTVVGECGLGDPAPAARLAAFGRAHGIDAARGVAVNGIRLDGTVTDPGARLWPQTERIKAAVARWRHTGEAAEVAEAIAAYKGLRRYLDVPVKGMWRDKLAADGRFVDEPAPASSFYHIILALSELIATAARM